MYKEGGAREGKEREVGGDPPTAAAAGRFDGSMLKFLTHKLRSHSLNEDPNNQEKADDDHDSGTESDDEFQNGRDVADELSTAMDSLEESAANDSAVPSDADLGASPSSTTTTPSSVFGFQHVPSSSSGCSSTETPPIEQSHEFFMRLAQTDQHSSEEELEVINGPRVVETANAAAATAAAATTTTTTTSAAAVSVPPTPLPQRSSAVPEKRKWSEANSGCGHQQSQQQRFADGEVAGTAYSAPVSRTGREAGSGSSDEEVQGLCYSRSGSGAISQPVQFRSSPPTDAHKPVRSLSPPPKLFHVATAYASSLMSSSAACLGSSSAGSFFAEQQQRPHYQHHHHHQHQHHRPGSRPRLLHSQHHSAVDAHHHHLHHHHHHHHQHNHLYHQPHATGQQQQLQPQPQPQQELLDLDVIGACSPRKRHRPPQRLPRPCLDFEKMQQMKTQAVTTWRHTSEHGKELSVFCW